MLERYRVLDCVMSESGIYSINWGHSVGASSAGLAPDLHYRACGRRRDVVRYTC